MEKFKGLNVPDTGKFVASRESLDEYCCEAQYNCSGIFCKTCLFFEKTPAFLEWHKKRVAGLESGAPRWKK